MYQVNQYPATAGQQYPGTSSGQHVIYQTAATPQTMVYQQHRPSIGEKYKKIFRRLGIIQIALGSSAILLAVLNIILVSTISGYYGDTEYIGTGIWCGGMILTCGILGKVSSSKPRYCPIIAAMVMCITTALPCLSMVAIETVGAVTSSHQSCYNYYVISSKCYKVRSVLVVFHALLSVIGVSALVTAIVHSAYCCASVCCGANAHTQTHYQVVYTASDINQQQTAHIGTSHQYAALPQYATVPPPVVSQTPTAAAAPQAVAGTSLVVDMPPPYASSPDVRNESKVPL